MRKRVFSVAILGVALIALLGGSAFAQAVCPNPPVVSVTSSVIPADVCIPASFPTNQNPIEFFDDFSWKSFVALVWPALEQARGKADEARSLSDPGVRVFETYKADWELFQASPSEWNTFSPANPCGTTVAPKWGDVVLASFSKFGNLGEAGFGDLAHALPAQNKTWVRYLTSFNEIGYAQLFERKLFILTNLEAASPLALQNGSINLKSAWISMEGIQHPDRYYTRKVTFMNVDGSCVEKVVGLVGFHIVQKTPTRPQWIWSSFEHVDNVPPSPSGSPTLTSFAFSDGTASPMPSTDPNGGFPPANWEQPNVYNVQRLKPIHDSTIRTNEKYRSTMPGVWKNYQLVLTQWPLTPAGLPANGAVPANQPGSPGFTFPGTNATTSFANIVLETWDQKSVSTGCMACHNVANQGTPSSDFIWSVQTRALTPNTAMLSLKAKQSSNLRGMLQLLRSVQ
jgi:hypothetical protein